jgi:TolB-like protein/tetratricopeptide (TPR) repeat protein
MPDLDPTAPDRPAADDKKKRKQAEKARGVWISFAGRIVAQIVGAVASVVLGIMVLQKYQQPAATPPVAATGAPATASGAPRRPGLATIAVLPLGNLSGNPSQDYFVEGMAEALTASLAQVEGLRVISRTSTMRYKTSPPPIPEIAKALGADLLVEGSVLQAGNDVRITAQLIDGVTDEHLWAQSYTRTLKDVIRLQDEVATAIATAIRGTVSRRPAPGAASDHVVEAATYDLYLRGRHAWFERTPASMKAALDYFQQAVDRDPLFALAHVGLADAYALQASPGMSLDEVRLHMDKARASAIRALDLNPSLAEAHTALGGVIFFGDRDLDDAAMKFRRAIEINPSYPVAHEWLGLLLSEQGRIDEALEHADIAVTLDPHEATMHQARGQVLYTGRRYAAAIDSLEKALELTPALPLARTVLVKALTLDGKAPAPVPGPDLAVACLVAATRAGRAEEAAARRTALEAVRPAPGPALAQADAALGRFAEALPRLERMAARGGLPPVLATDPFFDDLRRQPQWKALAATMAPRGRPQAPARPPS